MTASLPQDVQDVFDRFITTEYTTVDRRGQPITWPVTLETMFTCVLEDVTCAIVCSKGSSAGSMSDE